MSSKYKVGDNSIPHFITFTVIGWIDVFSRELYKEIMVNSLNYSIQQKGLVVHAWVIMTNHLHLIVSCQSNKIADIVRDIKKYTSKQIIEAIDTNKNESRKEWMKNMFKFAGSRNENNLVYQFWQQYYHPIELSNFQRLQQRMNYLHENPVRAGLVCEPWYYKYSSAIDYYTNENGLIKIEMI